MSSIVFLLIILSFEYSRAAYNTARNRHSWPMHLSMARCMRDFQKRVRAAFLRPVGTLPHHSMNAMQSGYVYKMFPSVGLVKEAVDDGGVAMLKPVVAFIDVVAVLAADVVTHGMEHFSGTLRIQALPPSRISFRCPQCGCL